MKKNILLLVNGFGIEKADSYNVYNGTLMPNMEALRSSKDNMFLSIPDKYLDYKSAYRNFSIGIDDSLSYNLIEKNIYSNEYKGNQLMAYIANELNKYNSKLHIVVYWDSNKTIDYLSYYLKELDKLTKSKIFVHIVLRQQSLNDYKEIERGFHVLNYEVNSSVKIGVVTGEKNMNDSIQLKEVIKTFITEYGEKWKDIPKKIEVALESKTIPCENRTFAVNVGFSVSDNDQFLFFNFSNIDVFAFRSELGNQKFKPLNLDRIMFYSLFPIKCGDKQVPFMYNYAIASNCFSESLKSINAKALVLDKKENCTYINYFLTGLRNAVDEHIKYLSIEDSFFDNTNGILETFKNYDNDLYIINYDISKSNTLEELKAKLKKIDDIIGILIKHCEENNWGLFISSLYGIEKEMLNAKLEKVKINFSGRAPVIMFDKDISFSKYSMVEPGSLYALSNTILWNVNKEFNKPGLIKKKSALLSFLYKKPKEAKK